MKDKQMSDTRLVQVFLSHSKSTGPGPSIYEVSSIGEDEKLVCTCPGYMARGNCKHTAFVKDKMDNNNGKYPLSETSRATKADLIKSLESNEEHRKFVIKFGKPEVF